MASQHNPSNQIKTRTVWLGYMRSGSDHSTSHGKVIFTAASAGRGGQEKHPPLPPFTSNTTSPPPPHPSRHTSAIRRERSWEISASRAKKQLLSRATHRRPLPCPLYQQIINYTSRLETQASTWREGKKIGKIKDLKWKVEILTLALAVI